MSSEQAKRPTSFDEMFPGRFLKAGLFKEKPVTLTISDVTIEALPSDKGGDQTRGIIHFKQTPMQLCLNKTNGVCLRAMFGTKPLEWVGKRVTFVPEKDKFGSETVDAIRIQGSPDIERAIDVEIRMPRKKPKKRRLSVTTGAKAAAKPADDEAMPPITDEQSADHTDFSDTDLGANEQGEAAQ